MFVAKSKDFILSGCRNFSLLLLMCVCMAAVSRSSEFQQDPVTGFPQQAITLEAWPDGKKVAVCFVFYVEVWGFGHGPNYRPDMIHRKPDLVNEYYRQYGINHGITRVGRLFESMDVPLSIALSALFPEARPKIWKQLRTLQPNAPIVAHGMNNSTQQLPLDQGLQAQKAYVLDTLNLIEKSTGIRPQGWSSPSVYANFDTYTATAAEGVQYSLDGMHSDGLSDLQTPSGSLMMIPYPVVTVDMGQNLARKEMPADIGQFWIDYVLELVREAADDPIRPSTVVAIGIHPFVSGTPAGTAALRRALERFQEEQLIWLTDVQAVYDYACKQ